MRSAPTWPAIAWTVEGRTEIEGKESALKRTVVSSEIESGDNIDDAVLRCVERIEYALELLKKSKVQS